jgi:hypothetical protein
MVKLRQVTGQVRARDRILPGPIPQIRPDLAPCIPPLGGGRIGVSRQPDYTVRRHGPRRRWRCLSAKVFGGRLLRGSAGRPIGKMQQRVAVTLAPRYAPRTPSPGAEANGSKPWRPATGHPLLGHDSSVGSCPGVRRRIDASMAKHDTWKPSTNGFAAFSANATRRQSKQGCRTEEGAVPKGD